MKTFDEFVASWFHDYLLEHEDEEEFNMTLFHDMAYDSEEDLSEGESHLDFLLALKAEDIWVRYVHAQLSEEDIEKLIREMLIQALGNIAKYDFVDEMIDEMAYRVSEYEDRPAGYFYDLQCGGCASRMGRMSIYTDACKQFYIEHIDDLEDFIAEFEGELGCSIQLNGLPRYTVVCWAVFEEIGHGIGRALFPGEF